MTQLNPNDLALVTAAAWRAIPSFTPQERPVLSKAILAVEAIVFGLTPPPAPALTPTLAEQNLPPGDPPKA